MKKILLAAIIMVCSLAPAGTTAEPIPLRGVVEGFYGTPWTQEKRLDIIKFCARHNLNAYIYAPKDDPYQAYPQDKIDELKTLADAAKKEGVKFIFAVSPGLDLAYDGEAGDKDFRLMTEKLSAVYDIGVRDFAVFFDDITEKNAKGQAKFINRLSREFVEVRGDISPIIAVPTEYFREDMTEDGKIKPYTKDFSENLDGDVLVLYTGDKVVGDGLSNDAVADADKIYGRRLGVWWNYPVTDYKEEKLALGAPGQEKANAERSVSCSFYRRKKQSLSPRQD